MRPLSSGPSRRLFEMLLTTQPFSSLLSQATTRFQSTPHRLSNDGASPVGAFREVWFGNSNPDRRPPSPLSALGYALGALYHHNTMYLVLQQLVEGQGAALLSSLLSKAFLYRFASWETPGDDKAKLEAYNKAKEDFFSGAIVVKRPGLYAGYLAIKCTVYSSICLVSHPFSIIRTVIAAQGDLPLPDGGFCANVWHYAGPRNPLGLYSSSIAAHVVSGLGEMLLTDVGMRLTHWLLADYSREFLAASGENEIRQIQKHRLRRRRRQRQLDAGGGGSLPLVPPPPPPQIQLPGTHQDRLRARLNKAALLSAVTMGVSFVARTVLFPLFTVRARLEAQGGSDIAPVNALRFAGLRDCVRAVWAQEGLLGFYRGFGAHMWALVGNGLWISLIYALTEVYIRLDVDQDDSEEEDGPFNW